MTDEHADAGSKTASPESVEPDEDRIQVAFDEILAQKCELEERGIILYCRSLMPEQWALVAAASIYSKAFVEALAKRHADGVADLVRKRVRRKDKPDEYRIGLDGDGAATVVVTDDLPDEARLALLDLDVTADDLRGKLLRWDHETSTWHPDDD